MIKNHPLESDDFGNMRFTANALTQSLLQKADIMSNLVKLASVKSPDDILLTLQSIGISLKEYVSACMILEEAGFTISDHRKDPQTRAIPSANTELPNPAEVVKKLEGLQKIFCEMSGNSYAPKTFIQVKSRTPAVDWSIYNNSDLMPQFMEHHLLKGMDEVNDFSMSDVISESKDSDYSNPKSVYLRREDGKIIGAYVMLLLTLEEKGSDDELLIGLIVKVNAPEWYLLKIEEDLDGDCFIWQAAEARLRELWKDDLEFENWNIDVSTYLQVYAQDWLGADWEDPMYMEIEVNP